MPNRILRDWTDSEKVNTLSTNAERFFTRLIMKADDNGCFHGNCKLLRSSLFPLKIDEVSEKDVQKWVNDCKEVGLLITYSEGSKDYIQICDFKQRLRIKTARFPLPNGQSETPQDVKNATKETPIIPYTLRDISEGPIPHEPIKQHGVSVDFLFNELPNTSHIETIAMRTGMTKERVISLIPEFRKAAELTYPTPDKFYSHFKNWINKRITEHKPVAKKRNQI